MSSTACYRIEQNVFSGRFASHLETADGMALADQKAIVEQLADRLDLPVITVERGQQRTFASTAFPEDHRIRFGALAGPAVVCHEVAHLMAPADHGHTELWRQLYVMCVGEVLGEYHAKRLLRAFEAHYGAVVSD